MKYAVIAGHNSIVPGARGNNYNEHEIARQVKDRVIHFLQQLEETAFDCTDEIGNTKSKVWLNAAKNANKVLGKDDIIIALHLNAGGGSGTEVFDWKGTQKAKCQAIAQRLAKDFAWPVRGDGGWKNGDWIGLIKEAKAQVLYIELCFIDNISDITKLVRSIDMAAIGIVEAVTGKTLITVQQASPVKTNSGQSLQKMLDKKIIQGYADGSLRENEPLTLSRLSIILDKMGLLD